MLINEFWHNLIQNPTDLPKNQNEVLVASVVGDCGVPSKIAYYTSTFNLKNQNWNNAMDDEIVIAWAEVPMNYKDFMNAIK